MPKDWWSFAGRGDSQPFERAIGRSSPEAFHVTGTWACPCFYSDTHCLTGTLSNNPVYAIAILSMDHWKTNETMKKTVFFIFVTYKNCFGLFAEALCYRFSFVSNSVAKQLDELQVIKGFVKAAKRLKTVCKWEERNWEIHWVDSHANTWYLAASKNV